MAQPGVVAPWRATYVPGDWFVIAGPTSLVVLEPGAGRADMVAELWADVVASSSMTDLIDRLAGYGLTELPDLGVVFWSTVGMRTLARGRVRLDDPHSGQQLASGEGVVTWQEVGLGERDQVRIRLRGQELNGEALPLAVGVVRAGGLLLRADEEAAVRSPQALLRSAAARSTGPSGRGVGGQGDPGSGSPSGLRHSAAAGAGTGESDPAQSRGGQNHDDERPGGATMAPAPIPPEHDTGPDFPANETDDDVPDDIGHTPADLLDGPWGPQATSEPVAAKSAGVGRGGASSAAAAAGSGAGGAGLGAAVAASAAGGAAGATAGGLAGATTGGVAGAAAGGTASGSVRAVGSPTEFSFDQFEMENDDTQVMAGAEGSGDWHHDAPTTPIEPTVEAVRCPHGHPNAPGSATCRICEASIANQTVELIPAPLLARLRTADGTVVDLDRAVLLGRAPSEQRSTAALPRLVTLASPAQDISRTHLQVTPEDWQVMATDLESTNGTFVTDRRGKRSLLPAGQPTPVQIGAVLDLGEGVSVTVEPAE